MKKYLNDYKKILNDYKNSLNGKTLLIIVLVMSAVIFGIFTQLVWLKEYCFNEPLVIAKANRCEDGVFRLLAVPPIMTLIFFFIHSIFFIFLSEQSSKDKLSKELTKTGYCFSLYLLSIFFLFFNIPLDFLWILFIVWLILIITITADTLFEVIKKQFYLPKKGDVFVVFIFILSGFSALIYQLIWQRSLFNIFGTNSESVTIVVSAFMLGLGLGSFIGGKVSKIKRNALIYVFGWIEIGIGVFGFFSLEIFKWANGLLPESTEFLTALGSFSLLILPTTLMGMTLPILAQYFAYYLKNIGQTVGMLYFVNTLGSAVACFFAAGFIFKYFNQFGSVMIAGTINLFIGTSVIWKYRNNK